MFRNFREREKYELRADTPRVKVKIDFRRKKAEIQSKNKTVKVYISIR